MLSLRYAQEGFSARSQFMRLCGWLQGRTVATLRSNPEACARVLASSNVKGQGIELMIACPAWSPVLSIESVDGEAWEWLSKEFSQLYTKLGWETKISPLTRSHVARFAERIYEDHASVLDAEQISRLTANILFEIIFGRVMTQEEENLFYQASLEWRKELAVKAFGSKEVKTEFWTLLESLLANSPYADDFKKHDHQRDMFMSLFAQPLILSPQINFSDIMAAVFQFLRDDEALHAKALEAARQNDLEFLRNICLESIRLKHPFPVLERELNRDLKVGDQKLKAGTQVYILYDEFEQDKTFDTGRWLPGAKNPYRSMPFGAGQRMCLGKNLAQDMLAEMLRGILLHIPDAKIRPSDNHLYSGRDNDGKDSASAVLHQIKIFTKVLRTSFGLGKQRRSGVCPFTGKSSAQNTAASESIQTEQP